MIEYEKRVNKRDIDYRRVKALLIVEDKIYQGDTHSDCIESMLSNEDDSLIDKIEDDIYNGTYSKKYAMFEVSNRAVIVNDQDSINDDLIRNKLLEYCDYNKYDLYVAPKIKDANYLIKLN